MADKTKTHIKQLVTAIAAPLVVGNAGWSDLIPHWLREQIIFDRLIEAMQSIKENRDPVATDSEALAYLIPVSMLAPLDYDWARIYLYLGKKIIGNRMELPSEFDIDELSSWEQQLLQDLKRWIYNKQAKYKPPTNTKEKDRVYITEDK